MAEQKYKKKVNPRPTQFGNFENFLIWTKNELKNVDLKKYGVKAK